MIDVDLTVTEAAGLEPQTPSHELNKPHGVDEGTRLASPVVSVIVPVYNKARHVAECLESILGQSLQDIEVVCIDDGSTDGSAELLDQFAQRDARIVLVHHEHNRGAASARNTGLEIARGDYVQFTDADDILPPDALRLLVKQARIDEVAVVRGGIVGFHTQSPSASEPLVSLERRRQFSPLVNRAGWIPWWHTTYLFSRQFLSTHGIRYPELRSGEDPVFLAQVLTKVPRMSTIPEVTYRYRLAPLKDKGRQTSQHVWDYVRHVEELRSLYLDAHPPAWYGAVAPALRPELEDMRQHWPLTQEERRLLDAEIHRLFDVSPSGSGSAVRKLLFMYNVCGLGGVETSIATKMEALRPRGIEVRALFQAYLGEGGYIAAQQPGFIVQGDASAQRDFIRQWQPDAIIVVDSPWLIDIAASSGIRCPILFESHLSERAAVERRVRGGIADVRVSAVVVPSQFNREFLAESGCDPQRVRIVPNPLDQARFKAAAEQDLPVNLGLPTDKRLILFVGRLEPAKNPLEFVRISAALVSQDPDIHCVMIGAACDPPGYAETVRAKAEDVGLPVTYREYVAWDDMPLYYTATAASGGCLLSTSLNESQPMTILEAMACGCPVVSSDVGGVREIIEDGRTGTLYASGEAPRAAGVAARVLRDTEYRAELVNAAKEYVKAQHGLEQCAAAYSAVLEEVIVSSTSTQGLDLEPTQPLLGASIGQRLAGLFTRPELTGVFETVEPYREVAPQVFLGFESGATVSVELRPKEDFSRSPDYCLNRLIINFRGPSRWLTIESPVSWEELDDSLRFQVGLYGQPSRAMQCRVMLRIPRLDKPYEDFRCCNLDLGPPGRSAHGNGEFRFAGSGGTNRAGDPRLLFYFDTRDDFELELDFLTAWFA